MRRFLLALLAVPVFSATALAQTTASATTASTSTADEAAVRAVLKKKDSIIE